MNVYPSFSSWAHRAKIAGCSTVVVMISLRLGKHFRADRMAVLSDSVPQEVRMISESCAAPNSD